MSENLRIVDGNTDHGLPAEIIDEVSKQFEQGNADFVAVVRAESPDGSELEFGIVKGEVSDAQGVPPTFPADFLSSLLQTVEYKCKFDAEDVRKGFAEGTYEGLVEYGAITAAQVEAFARAISAENAKRETPLELDDLFIMSFNALTGESNCTSLYERIMRDILNEEEAAKANRLNAALIQGMLNKPNELKKTVSGGLYALLGTLNTSGKRKNAKSGKNMHGAYEKTLTYGKLEKVLTFEGEINFETHKLLDTLLIVLYSINATRHHNPDCIIRIPLRNYLDLRGIDYTSSPTSLDNYADKVRRHLDAISTIRFKDERLTAGTAEGMGIGSSYRVSVLENTIEFVFDQKFAEGLLKGRAGYYPPMLLANTNDKLAYFIARKLLEQWFMLQNIERGTRGILRVKTILEYVKNVLQPYEHVQRGHWIDRIRKPFEDALNTLVTGNVISKWEYCKAGFAEATQAEIQTKSYHDWESLFVVFNIKNSPDMSDELQKRAKKKKVSAAERAAIDHEKAVKDAAKIIKADAIERRRKRENAEK